MAAPDESAISEIYIQPDGRVYVFGMSREVLDVLETLNPDDVALLRRLEHVRGLEARAGLAAGTADADSVAQRRTASIARGESTVREADA